MRDQLRLEYSARGDAITIFEYEVLNLGRPRESVVIEAYHHLVDDDLDAPAELAATVLERRIVTCEVSVPACSTFAPQ